MPTTYRDPQAVRQAILDSISHWERMASNPDSTEKPLADDCPLCRYFDSSHYYCSSLTEERCPIAVISTQTLCINTPYIKAHSLWIHKDENPGNTEAFEKWQKAAQKEIAFLKDVLKKFDLHNPLP